MQLLTIGILLVLGPGIIVVLKKGFNEFIKGLEAIMTELEKSRNQS